MVLTPAAASGVETFWDLGTVSLVVTVELVELVNLGVDTGAGGLDTDVVTFFSVSIT